MKKKLIVLILAILAPALCFITPAFRSAAVLDSKSGDIPAFLSSASNIAALDGAETRIIIKTHGNGRLDPLSAESSAEGVDGLHIFQYASKAEADYALSYYSALPFVRWAEFDTVIDALSGTGISEPGESRSAPASAQADSYVYSSWGAEYMGIPAYADYLRSIGGQALTEIVVAVADSGIDVSHPWFAGRIAGGGKNLSTSEVSSGPEYQDDNGHGTHVAGIICDLTLPNVKILPIKILNAQGTAAVSSLISSIYYTEMKKSEGLNIRALNFSLALETPSTSNAQKMLSEAIKRLFEEDVLTVSAAGNAGADVSGFTPGNIDCAITVSWVKLNTVTNSFVLSSGSNYGVYIDFAAPGESILSAKLGGGTVYMSGTSMATPHVSALVALLLSEAGNNFSAKQVESLLRYYAVDIGAAGKDPSFGYGFATAGAAYVWQALSPDELGLGAENQQSPELSPPEPDSSAPSASGSLPGLLPDGSARNGIAPGYAVGIVYAFLGLTLAAAILLKYRKRQNNGMLP